MATVASRLAVSSSSRRLLSRANPSTPLNLGVGCSRSSLSSPLRSKAARPYSSSTSSISRQVKGSNAFAVAAVGAGLGTSALVLSLHTSSSPVQCEAVSSSTTDYRPYASSSRAGGAGTTAPGDEVDSIVSISHLSFGTVTGFCAGVFVKKGLMAIAFLLGGGFVLLQYLHSRALITINWPGFARSYDSILARRTASQRGDSRLAKVGNGLVDFLTADFQGRATFLAGFVLGVRMG